MYLMIKVHTHNVIAIYSYTYMILNGVQVSMTPFHCLAIIIHNYSHANKHMHRATQTLHSDLSVGKVNMSTPEERELECERSSVHMGIVMNIIPLNREVLSCVCSDK